MDCWFLHRILMLFELEAFIGAQSTKLEGIQ
jgi:hypothetical protein